jgi:hypothetical protein
MSETTHWEHCDIEVQVVDDGRDGGESGSKIMWFRFRAHVTGPDGNYVAGTSEKVPMANMPGADAYTPQKDNAGHHGMLQTLVDELEEEGWQVMPEKGGNWWELKLRRPLK